MTHAQTVDTRSGAGRGESGARRVKQWLSGSAKMQGRGNVLSSVSLVLVFISSLVCV